MQISHEKNPCGVVLLNDWHADSTLPEGEKETLRLLFCRQGNVEIALNHELYELNGGDILICFPGDVMQVDRYRQEFSGCYLSILLKLSNHLFQFSSQDWKISSMIREIHLLSLGDDNIRLLLSYFNLFNNRLHHSALIDDSIGLYDLIASFIRDFLSIAEKMQHRTENTNISASNILFNKFIRILYSTSPQKQAIEYYADRLCVTPKYLSAICKEVAGETASTLINRCLMAEILNQLRNRTKPIQTIADELGFANQSFFGKYVKAHLGMTASQFRENRCFHYRADNAV